MAKRALLALENGALFFGDSIGADATAVGEVVFNTAITGYQEILTDPSYLPAVDYADAPTHRECRHQ